LIELFFFFQALDTELGEFICPVCRQMANGLLPVPPPAPLVPAATTTSITGSGAASAEERRRIAAKINQLIREESVHLVSRRL
jgi:hypothetical protein